jgi:anhydro-N-acetylmuramic acid kinase
MTDYFIGLMSGTSMDGVDAALIEVHDAGIKTIATLGYPMPAELRKQLLNITHPGENEITRMGQLDNEMGILFANATLALLAKANFAASDIIAIGSHGQTIRHIPDAPFHFTMQIGNPNVIAEMTNITTIADFRRRDMAIGGQGAPLTPTFHNHVFRTVERNRIILNIGGIANISILPANIDLPVTGFDTGPGNCLLDSHMQLHFKDKTFDNDGEWASSGKINSTLLSSLLSESYLELPPPKSTGRELFNLPWLEKHLQKTNVGIAAVDVQATLLEYTAQTISQAIATQNINGGEIVVCGGGCHNKALIQRLKELNPHHQLTTTIIYNIDPDFVEAIAFAWMAHATMNKIPCNLPTVTGASKAVILGGVYYVK